MPPLADTVKTASGQASAGRCRGHCGPTVRRRLTGCGVAGHDCTLWRIPKHRSGPIRIGQGKSVCPRTSWSRTGWSNPASS